MTSDIAVVLIANPRRSLSLSFPPPPLPLSLPLSLCKYGAMSSGAPEDVGMVRDLLVSLARMIL